MVLYRLEVEWRDSVMEPFTVDVADPGSRRSRGLNEVSSQCIYIRIAYSH